MLMACWICHTRDIRCKMWDVKPSMWDEMWDITVCYICEMYRGIKLYSKVSSCTISKRIYNLDFFYIRFIVSHLKYSASYTCIIWCFVSRISHLTSCVASRILCLVSHVSHLAMRFAYRGTIRVLRRDLSNMPLTSCFWSWASWHTASLQRLPRFYIHAW